MENSSWMAILNFTYLFKSKASHTKVWNCLNYLGNVLVRTSKRCLSTSTIFWYTLIPIRLMLNPFTNFLICQPRPLFCLFSFSSNNIFPEKLLTSAGFEHGSSELKASTWPLDHNLHGPLMSTAGRTKVKNLYEKQRPISMPILFTRSDEAALGNFYSSDLSPSHKRICLCAMFPAPHFGPHPFSLPDPTFVHSPGANVIKIVAKHSNRMLCDIAMWLVLTNWLECFISACSLVLYMTSIFCQCYRHGTQNCLILFFTTFLLNAPQFRGIL